MPKNEAIIISGYTGFIGRRLVDHLLCDTNYNLVLIGRSHPEVFRSTRITNISIENLDKDLNLFLSLNCFCLIHLAGIAHDYHPTSGLYREVNVGLTITLAKLAKRVSVNKFIFISSILARKFDHKIIDISEINYASSKKIAELSLIHFCENSDLNYVIIRPAVVYGAHVKGNFLRLINIVKKGCPLPFAGIKSKRAYLAMTNLINFIGTVIESSSAKNTIYELADEEQLSISQLVSKISNECKVKDKQFYIPIYIIKILMFIVGKYQDFLRLSQEVSVDNTNAINLGWMPVSGNKDLIEAIKKI